MPHSGSSQRVGRHRNGVGLIVVFVIRLAVTGDDPYDLLAMGFGYLAAAQAYKWHTTKAVSALLMATLCLAISLGWLWFYAIEG